MKPVTDNAPFGACILKSRSLRLSAFSVSLRLSPGSIFNCIVSAKSANSRLNRIRVVSGVFQWLIGIYAGLVIVLIAWIMDEGRKIQEEQELTV